MKVKAYAGWDDLPRAYLPLFEQWGSSSFFYSLPWFRNLAQNVLGEGDRLRIYGVEKDDATGTPVAALVTRYRTTPRGIFHPRALSGFSNYYTSLFGPMVNGSGEHAQGALQELARAICRDVPRWDRVDLKLLDADSFIFAALVKGFESAGMVVQTYFCFGNWYLPVNGRSYWEYFESLPESLRGWTKSRSRRLEKSGRSRLEIITGGQGLEAGIEAYEKIYRASWKVPEPYRHFVPGLIRTCAEMGWLRLGVLYVDDEPAAAELYVVNNGIASSFKCAYDKRFSKLSVGTVLSARMMEYVIDVDKVHEVDYLTGDDPYKKKWVSHRRERWGIVAFNPRSVAGVLGIVKNLGGRAMKRAWRRLAGGLGDHRTEAVRHSSA